MRAIASLALIGCGVAISTAVRISNVRRELPCKFIAKPEASVYIAKAGAYFARGIILAVEVHFCLRLNHQPLPKAKRVGSFNTARYAPIVANIKGRCKFELIRRKTLYTDRCPGASWIGIQVCTDADLCVEISHPGNGPIVQKLMIAIAHR